jgi:hypothetical protein
MNALQHNSNLEITTLDQNGSEQFWHFLSGSNAAPLESIAEADSIDSDEQFESRPIFRAVWKVSGRNKVKCEGKRTREKRPERKKEEERDGDGGGEKEREKTEDNKEKRKWVRKWVEAKRG